MKIVVLCLMFAIISMILLAGVRIRRGGENSLAKVLTVRITLSVLLFGLLYLSFYMGWLQPHHL